jgi:hypothetical protein
MIFLFYLLLGLFYYLILGLIFVTLLLIVLFSLSKEDIFKLKDYLLIVFLYPFILPYIIKF